MEGNDRKGIRIRKAIKEDIPELAAIFNYEVLNSTVIFCTEEKSLEDRLEWFASHSTEAHPLLTAELDGKAVGYVSLSPYRSGDVYDRTAELSLYVHREYRRRGIAGELLAAILELAREKGAIHTVVSVITTENTASIRLHEAFGFENCGVIREAGWKFGRWLDIVNYQLIL